MLSYVIKITVVLHTIEIVNPKVLGTMSGVLHYTNMYGCVMGLKNETLQAKNNNNNNTHTTVRY